MKTENEILKKARQLLKSSVSYGIIEKNTGISKSTLWSLRNNLSELEDMKFKHVLKLCEVSDELVQTYGNKNK